MYTWNLRFSWTLLESECKWYFQKTGKTTDKRSALKSQSHFWGSLKPKFYIIDILYWITVVQFRRTKQVFFFCVQRLHKTKKKLIWIVSIPYASPRWFPQSSPYHEKLAIRKGSIDWGVCLRGWGGEGSLLFLRDCTPTFPYCSFTTHDFSSGSFRLCCNLRISDNIPGTAIFWYSSGCSMQSIFPCMNDFDVSDEKCLHKVKNDH